MERKNSNRKEPNRMKTFIEGNLKNDCVSNAARFKSFGILFLALGLLTVPAVSSHAQIGPATATGYGPDDFDSSTLTPYPVITVGAGTTVPQCPWINSGLANSGFTAANGWVFTWANDISFLQPALTINTYTPWVVNNNAGTNNMIGGDGVNYNRNVNNQDAGGADFQLTYTPTGSAPTNNLHWIQAYQESFNGGAYSVSLDNFGGVGGSSFKGTNASPFYDGFQTNGVRGASGIGTLTNNGSWFLDIPYDFEAFTNFSNAGAGEESLTNTSVQFQVVLSSDTIIGGTNFVTIYGGDWWGYTYSNFDAVPEPSLLGLVAVAGAAWILRRRRS